MSTQDQIFDDDNIEYEAWPALGWIVLSAIATVTAFLLAPLP
jgi:hypothetical protein